MIKYNKIKNRNSKQKNGTLQEDSKDGVLVGRARGKRGGDYDFELGKHIWCKIEVTIFVRG